MVSLFFKLFCCNLIISSLVHGYDKTHKKPTLVNNYKGPNLSGAEFNPGDNKKYGHDYIYPNTTELDYYASKGFGIIRLPFDLRRVYHFPYSPLNSFEMGNMIPVVDYCLSKGMRVIIDPHNYGFIYDNRTGDKREIGIDQEGTNMFADFWGRMATVFKNYSNVIFGLMNEPYNQTAVQWHDGAIPAIKAIRAVGATQLILIPGTSWTGAHSWNASGNAAAWTGFNDDPLNNFAFEMHQYLDINSGGSHDECVTNSSSRLLVATSWLNANNFKGFLAEFGYSVHPTCVIEAPLFLDFISSNSNVWIGWTYWAGGLLWSKTDRFVLDPISFIPPIVDRPQLANLLAHL